jgi:hypothetical protein
MAEVRPETRVSVAPLAVLTRRTLARPIGKGKPVSVVTIRSLPRR